MLSRKDIKNLLFQKLKQAHVEANNSLQVSYFMDAIREVIREENASPEQQKEYHQAAAEIIHEWYRGGIIFFGKADDFQGYPFVTITEFGEKCIVEEQILSYDPDGFIEQFRTSVPQVDDLTITYLSESITTYNLNQLLSATITLGAASENIIIMLIEAYSDSIQNPQVKQVFESSLSRVGIYRKFELFKQHIDARRQQIPSDLWRDFLPELEAVFNFIRINRNAAGHPSGQAITKDVLAANYQIFASYSKKIFDLIDYLENNSIT